MAVRHDAGLEAEWKSARREDLGRVFDFLEQHFGGVAAHAEDDWVGYRVRVGDAVVRPTSETGRCLVTSQDPDTGLADMDMLQLIRETRPDDTGEPLPFGVHGNVAVPGTVRLGDPVEPL